MKNKISFEWLCKRWGISPYSSKSVYYRTFKREGIIKGTKPYKINLKKLLAYEKRVGFFPGMVSIAEYVRQNKGSTKYQVKQRIKDGSIKSCILCSSKNQIYYRINPKKDKECCMK